MARPTIKEIVYANLNDAMANDYNISKWPASDIVTDLHCYAEDCEDIEIGELLLAVLQWLKEKTNG